MVRIYFERTMDPEGTVERFGVKLSVEDGTSIPVTIGAWGSCPVQAFAVWLIRNREVVAKRSSALRKLINAAIRLAAPEQLAHQVAAKPHLLSEGLGTEVCIDGEEVKAWVESGNHTAAWMSRVVREQYIATWTPIKLKA